MFQINILSLIDSKVKKLEEKKHMHCLKFKFKPLQKFSAKDPFNFDANPDPGKKWIPDPEN